MKQPTDIHAALARIHTLLGAIAEDLTRYMDDTDMQYDPEYFRAVKDAALDAHLLVTWVKDQLSYPPQT